MAVYFNSEINKRSSNEDSFCNIEFRINHEASVHVMAVADGMGGLSGGRFYSRAAIRILNEKLLGLIMGEEFLGSPLPEQTELLEDFCSGIFQKINQELYTKGLNVGIKGGTTLTVALLFWHTIIIANCGDSPVYLRKGSRFALASEIQNAAWQMVKQGRTEEGSLLFYQNKARLLQYLGRREPVSPHIRVMEDRDMDFLLLGTDGAFGNLSAGQIRDLIEANHSRERFLAELFGAARSGGEEDNQTAILFTPDPGKKASHTRERQINYPDIETIPVSPGQGDSAVPGQYRRVSSGLGFLRNRIRGFKDTGGRRL